MSDWIAVAQVSELARHKRMLVNVSGQPVALFLVSSKIYALADTCIHKQRSLSKGVLMRGCIVCPGHQWEFNPETGYEATQDQYQPTFDVRLDGETVYVAPTPRPVDVSGVPRPAATTGVSP